MELEPQELLFPYRVAPKPLSPNFYEEVIGTKLLNDTRITQDDTASTEASSFATCSETPSSSTTPELNANAIAKQLVEENKRKIQDDAMTKMSDEWGNDWNTQTWNTGYSQSQNPDPQAAPVPQVPVQQPQQQTYSSQDYYSQQAAYQQPPQQPQAQQYQNNYQQQQGQQQNGFGQSSFGFQPQQFMSDPMLQAAQQFGGQFAEQQKEKLTKYLGTFNLKYYFSVDNAYVGKKLGILLFPFLHKDWTVKFTGNSEPYPAKDDVNAPDLYIPLMAFLTYVLVSGFILGTQGRFSPEILGILTSNAFIWIILENIIIFVSKYVMNISQSLSVWHSLAYSTYKFTGMILCLLMFMAGDKTFYYCTLLYTSVALVLFLLRSVSHFMFDNAGQYGDEDGRKRKLILVLFVVVSQPLIMWWLTSGVTSFDYDKLSFAQMALGKMGGGASKVEVPLTEDGDVDYEALLKMPKTD